MALRNALLLALCGAFLLSACSGGGSSSSTPALSPMATLGEKLFHDQTLSASGHMSCSTCHVKTAGFANDDGLAIAMGGSSFPFTLPGLRNTPSLAYTAFTPRFSLDGGPVGGFFRDGRAATLADQAQAPFINEFEMANADAAAVQAKLLPYNADFIAIFGPNALSDPATALARAGAAIAAYEKEDVDFHAFNSKFDAWRAGNAQLTAQELNGFALFNSPAKGNCAACHPSTSADGVTPALFTDFSYDNLGVPRNNTLAANDNSTTLPYVIALDNSTDGIHNYYDLGICGPLRTDISHNYANGGVCGAFKVPTLRNIARTAPYFHNGVFNDLKTALSFYVTRDTNPSAWYPTSPSGIVTKFDDLPAVYGGQFQVDINAPGSDVGYVGNVNTSEAPYNRHIGDQPALSPAEIDDVVAFLCTLTDGSDPANAATYVKPSQCP